ncbi:MAG: 2-dehydropantoate 2-reductase [Nitrososphaerota archaeon]
MRVLVVGAGAIGMLFAGLISMNGGDVVILTRRKNAEEVIRRDGVFIDDGERTLRARPECSTDPNIARDAELCLMCVKSYDTESVSKSLSGFLHEGSFVVTVQNGLNNVETLTSIFGPHRVIAGYTTHASTVTAINRVFHAHSGETVLGRHPQTSTEQEKIEAISRYLTRHGIKTSTEPNVFPRIVAKLIVNSVINPLTAVLKVRNGELSMLPSIRELIGELIEEGVQAGRELGVQLSVEEVGQLVYDVIRETGSNRSSMLQDVENGRLTEIEFINGAIAKILYGSGKQAPANMFLARLVRALEERALGAGR